jgi:protein-S-isoprenylcysteine O-methyltransferase Ste14
MLASFLALFLGFALNAASTWTTSFATRFGSRRGQVLTILLRDVLGIPLWVVGLAGVISAPSPDVVPSTPCMRLAAWCLVGTGSAVIAWALLHIRCRAVAPVMTDELETDGPYAVVRHPIYTGVILQMLGIVLLWPTVPVGLACLLSLTWLGVQAWLEERDLTRRRREYGDYARRVPRFFPRMSADAFRRTGRP